MYRYIFGPVNSRRLGISLGIDIVPYKLCSFNCIYCECGETTTLTRERKPYIASKEIIKELDKFLEVSPKLDYITFSGGGEPTLNSDIFKIIRHIKKNYQDYKIALLTNASLLNREDVIDDIKECDLIIPSIDASDENSFTYINRPCSGLDINKIIAGIKMLKLKSNAEIWLEIFIVPGINDTESELKKLKKIIMDISPQKVQLNTLDRPGTEKDVIPADMEKMRYIKTYLTPIVSEIVYDSGLRGLKDPKYMNNRDDILSLLKRRPSTIDDIVDACKIPKIIIKRYLHELKKCGKISSENKNRGEFYKLNNHE